MAVFTVKILAKFMIELEVYAAGVRDLDKIMQLDHLLETVSRACATRSIAITTSFTWSSTNRRA